MTSNPTEGVTIVASVVAHHYKVATAELLGPSLRRPLPEARKVSYHLIRAVYGKYMPMPFIGQAFGRTDKTIYQAMKTIDPNLNPHLVEHLQHQLNRKATT